MASAGGYVENGLRALVGIPVFQTSAYYVNSGTLNTFYNTMKAAEDAHYVMIATTGGIGDAYSNECGIAQRHAYSILAAFTMTDSAGTAHKCLLMRNPWGRSTYSGTWSKSDSSWTDALIAQVPYGHDPRTE